jgi:hypothetical protein
MNSINTRIIAMYETAEMTAEEIAMDEGLEVEVVKATLLQGSGVYRSQSRGASGSKEGEKASEEEPFMTEDEFRQVKAAYKQIALDGDVDSGVRERALRNLINEHKGRNDTVNLVKNGGNINILMLNESLLKARRAIENARSRRDIILDVAPDPGQKLIEQAA